MLATSPAKGAMPEFDLLTPMLVMPYSRFKEQGRIMKSVKGWRDEALTKGWLIEHTKGSGKSAIFISHTWWDREFRDPANDRGGVYDKGAPDYQADYASETRGKAQHTYQRPKDLKWRVICAGVERLVKQVHGLKEEEVVLWIDWQSIWQDDEVEKHKGVTSLIAYATLCEYMLVPTEEEGPLRFGPEYIPGYGSRGWWYAAHLPSNASTCAQPSLRLIPCHTLSYPVIPCHTLSYPVIPCLVSAAASSTLSSRYWPRCVAPPRCSSMRSSGMERSPSSKL